MNTFISVVNANVRKNYHKSYFRYLFSYKTIFFRRKNFDVQDKFFNFVRWNAKQIFNEEKMTEEYLKSNIIPTFARHKSR